MKALPTSHLQTLTRYSLSNLDARSGINLRLFRLLIGITVLVASGLLPPTTRAQQRSPVSTMLYQNHHVEVPTAVATRRYDAPEPRVAQAGSKVDDQAPDVIATPADKLTFAPRTSVAATEQLRRQIEALAQDRERVANEHTAAGISMSQALLMGRLQRELQISDQLHDDRLEVLAEKINKLQLRRDGQDAGGATLGSNTRHNVSPTPSRSADVVPPWKAAIADRAASDMDQEATNDALDDGDSPLGLSATTTNVAITAAPITGSAIDRTKLADNLFANGQADLALQIYQDILSTAETPSDHVWIQYQIACCHRQLGNLNEAEKIYYILAKSEDHKYWAANSRWWLRTISDNQRLQQQKEKVTATLDALQENTNALIAP